MKIAVVINRYGLIGGAERFVFELTERLARLDGFQVHVLTNKWQNGGASITFHKIPIVRFPRWFRPVSFAYFAKRVIQAETFDIVHSHERILEMNLFSFNGLPHETWIKETKRKHLSLFDRTTAWIERKGIQNKAFHTILPVSTLVKEELLKLYDIPESKICVVHPGVSIDRFSNLDKAVCRKEIRTRHGMSETDVVVLFVGMNFEIKRLELVLKSVADMVKKGNKSIKLLVVGKGDKTGYSSMARDLGINEKVIFAGVREDVEKYYMAGDIFAMPSLFESFGLAVLEAMAAGLPVIISGKVGARDIVHSASSGLILPESPTPSDMTEAFSHLMEPARRKKMGEKAKQAAQKHDWTKVAHQVAQIYKKMPLLNSSQVK